MAADYLELCFHWPIAGSLIKNVFLEMGLVEISPSFEGSRITLIHAETLICNFIGAAVRQGYYS